VEAKSTNCANDDVACEECGNFGAQEIGDLKLCADCLTLAGSSCAGGDEPLIL
jgi:hypothetical protein